MTYLTDIQIAQNLISKGDVVLRWYDTRWAEKIVRLVDVADGMLNPLGQIFGNYQEGLKQLRLTEAEAAECGFVSRLDVGAECINDLWNHHVLNSRRVLQ
jgi:hypothetical protein